MTRQIFYILLLLLISGYALIRGGPPEKIGGATVAIGTILSVIVASTFSQRFRHVEIGMLAVDIAVFGVFVALSLRSTRFWPIWTAALQSISVVTHIVRETVPEIVPQAYMDAVASWSYPILLLVAVGTWRHRRRLSQAGMDRPWKATGRTALPATFADPKSATGRPAHSDEAKD